MTLFADRERAAEWAFAHEGEVRFLAHCTAVKALAGHAAGRLGLGGDEAEDYARNLVSAAVGGLQDDALIERVRTDLEAGGVAESAADLRARMTESLARTVLNRNAA